MPQPKIISLNQKRKEVNKQPLLEAFLHKQQKPIKIKKLAQVFDLTITEIQNHLSKIDILLKAQSDRPFMLNLTDNTVEIVVKSKIKTSLNKLQNENNETQITIVDEFLYSKESEGNRNSTITQYGLLLERFIKAINKSVSDIKARDIRYFLMQEKQKRGNSRNTISTKFSTLKSFFNWLESEEIIDKNPARKIKKPQKDEKNPKPFSREEIEELREAASDMKLLDRVIFEVMYSSGVRISECINLNWDNIDFQKKRLEVIEGKGGKSRVTLLSSKAVMLLKKYKQKRKDYNSWIFQSQYKQRMSRSTMYRRIKKIGIKAKIHSKENKVHPHRLRHSFGSHLLGSGMPLHEVQKLMGHTKPSTTQGYAETTQANVEHSYRKVFH